MASYQLEIYGSPPGPEKPKHEMKPELNPAHPFDTTALHGQVKHREVKKILKDRPDAEKVRTQRNAQAFLQLVPINFFWSI